MSVLCPQAVKTEMTREMINGGIAGIDGVLEASDVSRLTLDALEEGRFLITPHSKVREYQMNKARNTEKWILGMRKLKTKYKNI